MSREIFIEPNIEIIAMPENLRIGMMVSEQHKKCQSVGHVATITGDTWLLDPDDFGARIAFVDYDGKNAFEDYKRNAPKSKEAEIAFVKKHAPRMVEGIEVLHDYINKVRSDSLEYCAT